ncbi:AAA family ATPase [Mycobacterium sp. 2-64]|uniref:AAA family ATPase n=1 Tax=Mycobacterium sp. 2-64 TaxID=3042319 RepID=UPI002DDA497F|nr:AAA family ATPase [Mycobacterium sp. 2-64]WSE52715.1 AAA family ATPase [Mycobacterium sp. 2-64]
MQDTAPQGNRAVSPEANGHNGNDADLPDWLIKSNEKHRQQREAQAVTEERCKRWAPWRYAVEDLPRGQRWARDLHRQISRDNARRDSSKYSPELSIPGDRAVKAGATDEQLAAMPALTDEEYGALREREAAELEAGRLRVRSLARQIEAARAAAEVEIVERVNLAEFAPDETPWVVDGVLARGAVLGLFAERKAGKTTLVRELVRSALDGTPFLGRFAVSLPADAEVVLFDTEMTLNGLHNQYRRGGVEHLDRLNLRSLRGRERSLDARIEAVRARWREQVMPGSLIAVDCLYSLFGALGVSENSDEVVAVLAGLRSLATECQAAGLVIVHHLGKDADRGARGHSSLEGFPDAIARIELDGPPSTETTHVFSAYGRDVAVDAAVLTLGEDHRLTLGGNPRAERISAAHRADDDATWRLIDQHPGLSVRALGSLPVEARGKLSRDRIRTAVDRLALLNRIVNKGSNGAPEWHAVEGVDPFLAG